MTLGDWNDFMEHTAEERERLHKQALKNYAAWLSDRQRRDEAYSARVETYHATLNADRPPAECQCPCCKMRKAA